MKRKAFLFILFFLPFFLFSQIEATDSIVVLTKFKIDKIPDAANFKKLNGFEQHRDSLYQEANRRSTKSIRDGSAFIKGVSAKHKRLALAEQEYRNQLHYSENRSRYEFQVYKNGRLRDSEMSDSEDFGTECFCTIDKDNTITIKMGVWVFGGFEIGLSLRGDLFATQYWIDQHKSFVLKRNLAESLQDNIYPFIAKDELILEKKPAYRVGEQITGYINFQTKPFYVAPNTEQEDHEREKNMKEEYHIVKAQFTCKVMPPFNFE